MKNTNLFNFQNGLAIVLASLEFSSGKYIKADPYMYLRDDGYYYTDKAAIAGSDSYQKDYNYIIYNNGDYVTVLYYTERVRGNYAGSAQKYSIFQNSTLLNFNNLEDALVCLTTGSLEDAVNADYIGDQTDYMVNESYLSFYNISVTYLAGETITTKESSDDGYVFFATEDLDFRTDSYTTKCITKNKYDG